LFALPSQFPVTKVTFKTHLVGHRLHRFKDILKPSLRTLKWVRKHSFPPKTLPFNL